MASLSYLSSSKYGYDFVVATTQASINAGLLNYLAHAQQPPTYICFLVDPTTGNPGEQISLEDLMKRTNGVNPFDIPADTPYNDDRITTLKDAMFICGIKIQMGLPPKIPPTQLPAPVVDLGDSAENVRFSMYCREFLVIQNTPPGAWGSVGYWNVWSQSATEPWFVQANVNLTTKDLDRELDTPYFANHPEEKEELKKKLMNISDQAFSLKQLLFDLDNASTQTVPTFAGIPEGSKVEIVLQSSFIRIYREHCRDYGEPLISVNAVAGGSNDPSQLLLTGLERMVNPLVDTNSGLVIENPTNAQQAAATLNYLCATDNHHLPSATRFGWNWVSPQDIGAESGYVAINRNIIGDFIKRQLMDSCKQNCFYITVSVDVDPLGFADYDSTMTPGQTPQSATITTSGSDVIKIHYETEKEASKHNIAAYVKLKLKQTYDCTVSFQGERVTVKQRLFVHAAVIWASTVGEANICDKTITDVFEVSVDQYGSLHMEKDESMSSSEDHSQSGHEDGFIDFFTGINGIIDMVKGEVSQFTGTSLKSIPMGDIQNFIFPGGKVFTYKNARFSDHQDLISAITYVNTASEQIPVAPRQLPVPKANTFKPGFKVAESRRQKMMLNGSEPTTIQKKIRRANQVSSVPKQTRVTYSTELMQNYVHGELLSPRNKFEALQTADGHALLFAIDTAGVFHVIEEQSGVSSTGWNVIDLSTALIESKFPGGTVRTFGVGQSVVDGTVGIAMAVSYQGSDNLFVSLFNSNRDTSWLSSPNWTSLPFDNQAHRYETVSIIDVLFSEAASKQQYIIVDIDRSDDGSVRHIERYHIDSAETSSEHWKSHDVSVDIEDGSYQSCTGQAAYEYVDGVYTAGTVDGAAQLVYEPIINVYVTDPSVPAPPPQPSRLKLPGDIAASAIATARNDDATSDLQGSTDLYVVGEKTLFRFAAEDQTTDSTTGAALITNPIFSGTDTLRAMCHDGVTTVWGKNGSDVVYYVSCLSDQVGQPGSWSAPVPIVTGIERLSAYLNRQDGGNTIFASGGNKLVKLTQATDTPAKLWQKQDIKLAAVPEQKSQAFKSYTTTIRVLDENDLPVKNIDVSVKAKSRVAVYVNGLYYVLSQVPVMIATDSTGSVTIIEATESITSSIFEVSVAGGSESSTTVVNPMQQSYDKLAKLNTKDALQSATFVTDTKAGGKVSTSRTVPLVSSSVADEDLEAAAKNMTNLGTVHDSLSPSKLLLKVGRKGRVVPRTTSLGLSRGFWDFITVPFGDLWNWLWSGVEALVEIVQEEVTKVWHFVVTVADQVYHAVLDTVEAVLGAIEWVIEKIVEVIEDVIHFIEFLFEWDDISRTKDVLHNVTKRYLDHMVAQIPSVQSAFDKQIAEVEGTIAAWAGIEDWSPLGPAATKPANGSSTDPTKDHTSGSMLLAHHFQNQVNNMSVSHDDPSVNIVEDLITDLQNAVSNEGAVLSAIYDQLRDLAADFHSLSVGDVLRRIAGILAEGVLSSVQVVVDALLNVLYHLAESSMSILDAKLHIPIISDILNAIGIEDISFLDLFSWIAAVGYTVVYKIVEGEPPFPDDANTKAIKSAGSWDELSGLFSSSRSANGALSETERSADANPIVDLPAAAQQAIHVAGHATAGFLTLISDFVSTFEALGPSEGNPFGAPAAVINILISASLAAANELAPKAPLKNEVIKGFNTLYTVIGIASGIVFTGWAQKKFAAPDSKLSGLAVDDGRAFGAMTNSILVIPALFSTCWHFYELSEIGDSAERSAAIVGEVSSLCSYISTVSYAAAVNTQGPEAAEVKLVEVGIMAVSRVAVAGLQTAEAAIH